MAQPRGIRLRDEDDIEINSIAEQHGTTFSTVIANIVHNYLKIERSKEERGDITLAGEIVKNRHEYIKKLDITKIVKKDAKFIIKEMRFQADLNFDELKKRITEWNNIENKLKFVAKDRKESVLFIGQHRLGKTGSEIQCKMYCKMFEMIKDTVIKNSIKYDTDSFEFEVVRHKQ